MVNFHILRFNYVIQEVIIFVCRKQNKPTEWILFVCTYNCWLCVWLGCIHRCRLLSYTISVHSADRVHSADAVHTTDPVRSTDFLQAQVTQNFTNKLIKHPVQQYLAKNKYRQCWDVTLYYNYCSKSNQLLSVTDNNNQFSVLLQTPAIAIAYTT